MPFIPHTEQEVREMLAELTFTDINQLFSEIPQSLFIDQLNDIPDGMSEMSLQHVMQLHAQHIQQGQCFAGAGAYQHYIPAAVWDIAGRGEFLTAYTPYQAEISQGMLQLIFEYQTMISSLTGMHVANASLYDGATALAEAALMAVRLNKKAPARVLMPANGHPHYQAVVKTLLTQQSIELVTVPFDEKTGRCDISSVKEQQFAAVIIQQPNFFGVLESVDQLTDWAHQQNALVIASVNPVSLMLCKEPGQWGQQGADIVCGEGQPLGVPLAFGGPYFGFLTTKENYLRQMPGRIVGKTVDQDQQPGYVLTLQAREQHIRRGKATSNICTNQGLLVVAATIYMSLLGKTGLRQVALACHDNTRYLVAQLAQHTAVKPVFNSPYFHEVLLRCPGNADDVLQHMHQAGFLAGVNITEDFNQYADCLLVCVTETKTRQDIDDFVAAMRSL